MKLKPLLSVALVALLAPMPPLRAGPGPRTEVISLDQARQMALRNHPRLAVAEIQAMIAQEAVKAAQAGYYPTLQAYLTAVDAGNENTRILAGGLNNPSIYDREAGGLEARQLITDFGRTVNLSAGSKAEARARTEGSADTRAQILLRADITYYDLLETGAVLRVAEQTVAAQNLLSEQVRALAAHQLKSDLDVSFSMVGLEQARLLLQKAEGDNGAAQAALAEALGLHEPHVFEAEDPAAASPGPAPGPGLQAVGDLIDAALSHRPDLLELRYQRDAAQRYARAEDALSYPTLSAVASVGASPDHDVHLPNHYAAGGIQLGVPLFTGGLYAARERQAEMRARIADENLREAEDVVVRDVQVARLNVDVASQRFETARQLVKHADEAFRLAQARYRLGSSSIIEISEAQLNATAAGITLASARYDALIQRAILDYQTGSLH